MDRDQRREGFDVDTCPRSRSSAFYETAEICRIVVVDGGSSVCISSYRKVF